MAHDLPVMAVLFDEEGDWQVLCGETQDPKDGLLVCLGCAYEKNPEIGQFANSRQPQPQVVILYPFELSAVAANGRQSIFSNHRGWMEMSRAAMQQLLDDIVVRL